ncbi:hypothetical protein ABW21_db0207455 [Orbilia brochopaga]|nr:hypothetical protein ABW21_db0207455 [Drechslerella brochopaga]
MSKISSLVDLPVETLRKICSHLKDYKSSIHALSLTCKDLAAVAAEYRFESINVEANKFGFNYRPFASTPVPESVREMTRFPKCLNLFPCGVLKQQDSYQPRSRREGCSDIKKVFAQHANISFDKLESLSFYFPFAGSVNDYNRKLDLVKEFPHIKRFAIRMQHQNSWDGINAHRARSVRYLFSWTNPPESLLCLKSLEHLSFEVYWPNSKAMDEIDLSAMWELIENNTDTLECLRTSFLDWTPDMTFDFNDPFRIEDFFKSLEMREPSVPSWSRRNLEEDCPMLNLGWQKKLNLKVFQIELFPNSITSRLFNLGFLQPQALRVLSLIFCDLAGNILRSSATSLPNLKCLQVIGRYLDLKAINDALMILRPLEALYVSAIEPMGTIFGDALEKHKNSIRCLVLATGEGSERWPTIPSSPEDPPVDDLTPCTANKYTLDFTNWSKLEELTYHVTGDLDEPEKLHLPPSLRFLSIVDPESLWYFPADKYHDFVSFHALRCIRGERVWTEKCKLQAIIISPTLPPLNDMGHYFRVIETKISKGPAEWEIVISVNKVDERDLDFDRSFPGVSIVRRNRKASAWINQFI